MHIGALPQVAPPLPVGPSDSAPAVVAARISLAEVTVTGMAWGSTAWAYGIVAIGGGGSPAITIVLGGVLVWNVTPVVA